MNLIKKTTLLLFAILMTITFGNKVKAEGEVCKTYRNYYFYTVINKLSYYAELEDENFTGSAEEWKINDNWTWGPINTQTFFSLDDLNKAKNIKPISVCIKRDNTDNTTCAGFSGEGAEIWTLEEFYESYLLAANSGVEKRYNFTDPVTGDFDNPKTGISKMYFNEAASEKYYTHGQWYIVNADDTKTEGGKGVDLGPNTANNITKLVKASILPVTNGTTISTNYSESIPKGLNSFSGSISRNYNATLNTAEYVTAGEFTWNGTPALSILSPSLNGIEYELCETAYNATINYYYYKDGKTTTEPVEFDDNSENPYTDDGLAPGTDYEVDSPSKQGCKIVDTNGNTYDKDKIVNVVIDKNNPTDFTKNVYYYCPIEDKPVQKPTGDFLIYIAWAIGLGAIGYSVYYFTKLRKEEI